MILYMLKYNVKHYGFFQARSADQILEYFSGSVFQMNWWVFL